MTVLSSRQGGVYPLLWRLFAHGGVALGIGFVINTVLVYWFDWPGVLAMLSGHQGGVLGVLQVALNAAVAVGLVFAVLRTGDRALRDDSDLLTALAAYIVRSCFWAVTLIGVVDMALSFLRVEDFLSQLVSADMAQNLGSAAFRGAWVHYPLLAVGLLIGALTRSLSFTWLGLMIVLAEFLIVLTRFIFSYEQAFMGDLVRFWYAALFLFASAHTLIEEGHVRVDILYTNFSERGKAWSNTLGTLLLGIPVCWVILIRGMWSKNYLINAPLLSYEVTQSNFGLYVKYLMAGFLMIYALTMLIQFWAFFLNNVATLLGEEPRPDASAHAGPHGAPSPSSHTAS